LQCLGVQTLNFALDVVDEAPSAQAAGRHAACSQQVWPTRRIAALMVLPARREEAIGFRDARAGARRHRHRPRSTFYDGRDGRDGRAASAASQPLADAQHAELSRDHVWAEQPAAGAPNPRRRGRLWRTLPAALADRRGVDRKHVRLRDPAGEQPEVLAAFSR
jgi:hypothetical protein